MPNPLRGGLDWQLWQADPILPLSCGWWREPHGLQRRRGKRIRRRAMRTARRKAGVARSSYGARPRQVAARHETGEPAVVHHADRIALTETGRAVETRAYR